MKKEKTVSTKLTLYPKQLSKIKRIALKYHDGNKAATLRRIIDAFKEEEESK